MSISKTPKSNVCRYCHVRNQGRITSRVIRWLLGKNHGHSFTKSRQVRFYEWVAGIFSLATDVIRQVWSRHHTYQQVRSLGQARMQDSGQENQKSWRLWYSRPRLIGNWGFFSADSFELWVCFFFRITWDRKCSFFRITFELCGVLKEAEGGWGLLQHTYPSLAPVCWIQVGPGWSKYT